MIDKWLTLELRLFKDAKGIGNGAFARPFAYSGICAYESTDPGTKSWKGKYNGLAGLPSTDKFKIYHWPSCVNASLAEFKTGIFLRPAIQARSILRRSIPWKRLLQFGPITSGLSGRGGGCFERFFGKVNRRYRFVDPVPDRWVLTKQCSRIYSTCWPRTMGCLLRRPLPRQAVHFGNNRPIVAGSGDNAQPSAPTAYSVDPKSPFCIIWSTICTRHPKNLTQDQKNWALFWQDVPGPTTPGHWMSITQQVIAQTHSRLDKASMTFALVGICVEDAVVSVFKTKYTYNLIQPVGYIRKVFGDTTWLPAIATPATSGNIPPLMRRAMRQAPMRSPGYTEISALSRITQMIIWASPHGVLPVLQTLALMPKK